LRDAGRAETRDVLESQEALIGAKNAYTAALISLAVTRLQFHSETGTLRIEPDGRFSEAPMEEAKNVRS
jgi:outer membrane protein TolC